MPRRREGQPSIEREVSAMRERKQTRREQQRTGADAEFTQYMENDPATMSGGNTAYGNSPGNQGARLVAAHPEEEPARGE